MDHSRQNQIYIWVLTSVFDFYSVRNLIAVAVADAAHRYIVVVGTAAVVVAAAIVAWPILPNLCTNRSHLARVHPSLLNIEGFFLCFC